MKRIPITAFSSRRSPKKTSAAKADTPGFNAKIGEIVEISIVLIAFAMNKKVSEAKNADTRIIKRENRLIFEKSIIKMNGNENTKFKTARVAEKLVECTLTKTFFSIIETSEMITAVRNA